MNYYIIFISVLLIISIYGILRGIYLIGGWNSKLENKSRLFQVLINNPNTNESEKDRKSSGYFLLFRGLGLIILVILSFFF